MVHGRVRARLTGIEVPPVLPDALIVRRGGRIELDRARDTRGRRGEHERGARLPVRRRCVGGIRRKGARVRVVGVGTFAVVKEDRGRDRGPSPGTALLREPRPVTVPNGVRTRLQAVHVVALEVRNPESLVPCGLPVDQGRVFRGTRRVMLGYLETRDVVEEEVVLPAQAGDAGERTLPRGSDRDEMVRAVRLHVRYVLARPRAESDAPADARPIHCAAHIPPRPQAPPPLPPFPVVAVPDRTDDLELVRVLKG